MTLISRDNTMAHIIVNSWWKWQPGLKLFCFSVRYKCEHLEWVADCTDTKSSAR